MVLSITIEVVAWEHELLFKHRDLLFDKLSAYEEFKSGKLTALRNSQVIYETFAIDWQGTHAECVCFIGRGELAGQHFDYAVSSGIVPEQFITGDTLILQMPEGVEDFESLIYANAAIHQSALNVFKERGDRMSFCEFINHVSTSL